MSKQQKKRTRWLYAGFAAVMVLLMGCAGLMPTLSQLLDNNPSGTTTPVFPTPAPGTPSTDVQFDAPFVHPSGYFEIIPPSGWTLRDASAEDIQGSAWIGNELLAVVHTFVKHTGQPGDREAWVNFVKSEFPSGFGNYEDYMVTEADYEGETITINFSARFEGLEYIAREWSGMQEDVVWVVRIVTPANYPALLDYLGEHILPTLKVYPDAVPVPEGWVDYTDYDLGYGFKHPEGWANRGTGADGVHRFVDSDIGAEVGMGILVQPGESVTTETEAEERLMAIEPDAKVTSVRPATRSLGEGYVVSFTYPYDEIMRRGMLLLLNANDAVYRVDMRLPVGLGDPLDEEAAARADIALKVFDSFTALRIDAVDN